MSLSKNLLSLADYLEQYIACLDEVASSRPGYEYDKIAICGKAVLSETFVMHHLFCLKDPSNVYTFQSSKGVSDIDMGYAGQYAFHWNTRGCNGMEYVA